MREEKEVVGNLIVFWSTKLRVPGKEQFQSFLNAMAKRIIQGHARYGPPKKDKNYMTRLEQEFRNYKKYGNMENLLNIANYAYLESVCPENKKFHFDNEAKSVTRVE